jgi:putative ABC transport system substrate-binding protein
MLIGIVPKLSRVAVLMNPANAIHPTLLKNIEDAAQKVGVKVLPVKAQGPEEIENAFSIMAKENTRALLVGLDSVFIQRRRHIAELAATNRLPSISTCREYVEDGGLMSYGQNLAQQYWRAASYVDKIFKGARPADLPVEQSTKFELIINRKTAKALGLTIPQSLLISADRVIE